MADAKITDLAELTTPALEDLIAVVDDPSGSPVTKKVKLEYLANWMSNSLSRQAIINGNFDVWQRGTSLAVPQDARLYLQDRWYDYAADDGGTAPTLTRSRQVLTSGNIPNSFFYTRLATNGAGTSLGNSSQHFFTQRIENGTRNLCGDGKKVTLSFWAKSDIANKKLGYFLIQNYGTGGSPTSQETITGASITLTSSWTKYTYTFTTNTLASKTFGTDYNDVLIFNLAYQWGSTLGTAYGLGDAETYVGAGDVDIAKVQLCAGDVALPFQPKSFEEELRACQRYFNKSYNYSVAPATNTSVGALFSRNGYTESYATAGYTSFPVEMRTTPTTITWYAPSGTAGKCNNNIADEVAVTTTVSGSKFIGANVNNVSTTAGTSNYVHYTADAEL